MKFEKDNSANRLTAKMVTDKKKADHERDLAQKKALKKKEEEAKKLQKVRVPFVKRRMAYPDVREQLDMLWHDMEQGHIKIDKNRANTWYQTIKTVKSTNPLPDK